MDDNHDKYLPKNKAGENHLHLPRTPKSACVLPAIKTGHWRLSFHHLQRLGQKCGTVEKYLRPYNLGDHKASRRAWELFGFMSWRKLFRHPHGQNIFHEVKLLKDQSICISIITRHPKKAATYSRCPLCLPSDHQELAVLSAVGQGSWHTYVTSKGI